ncbi:MAG: D-tyrosyl-tRNA(Tyr) deacylase [Acidimicrobiia bacterium]|nr:D-tyrosyl-tRNA(Tyr) deacylase [Acidimicrobiia bacterium]
MRAVLQRVSSALVTVTDEATAREVGRIGCGLLAFVGVEVNDGPEDVRYITDKIQGVRVFPDPADAARMTKSVVDVGGAVLVVSQFTLAGDCRYGRRPSFDTAAPPAAARPLYEDVVRDLREAGVQVATGEFQATMQVALVNDGPVTVLLDSRRGF